MANPPTGYARDPITNQLQFVGRLPRPPYYCDNANSIIKVDASTNLPAILLIGAQLYNLTSNLRCNFSTSGAGGLDVGSIAANTVYYIYIVNNSGSLDLVASTLGPATGPRGFTQWTYLGGCVTNSSSIVTTMSSSGGTVRLGEYSTGNDVTVNEDSLTAKTFSVPTHASFVHVVGRWVAVNAVGDYLLYGSTSGGTLRLMVAVSSTPANNDRGGPFELALVTSKTAYFNVLTATTDSVALELNGWQEEPWRYT